MAHSRVYRFGGFAVSLTAFRLRAPNLDVKGAQRDSVRPKGNQMLNVHLQIYMFVCICICMCCKI